MGINFPLPLELLARIESFLLPEHVFTYDYWLNLVQRGNVEGLQWFREHHLFQVPITLDKVIAISHSHTLATIQWFHRIGVKCTTDAMDKAAATGQLDVVQFLHTHRTEGCTTYAMDMAASGGHLSTLQWLHQFRTEGCTTLAMDLAALNGHLHILVWLHEHRREGCTTDAMDNAAGQAHLHIVKWLHDMRTEGCTTDAMDEAIRNGHLHVASWLHSHRNEGCTHEALDYAMDRMDFTLIEWLVDTQPQIRRYVHDGWNDIRAMLEHRAKNWLNDLMDGPS